MLTSLDGYFEGPDRDINWHDVDVGFNEFAIQQTSNVDILTIWRGEKGSPTDYQGAFSADGYSCEGGWVYPGGGGYESTMTRVK